MQHRSPATICTCNISRESGFFMAVPQRSSARAASFPPRVESVAEVRAVGVASSPARTSVGNVP